MFNTQSMLEPRDVAGNKHSNTFDLVPALSTQSGTSAQKDNSITLWGPGVNMQETPSSIMTQSLHVWRKDNAQLPAARAAEELHNLYENLPPEALELTFQDMIRRNNSPKGKSDEKAGKNTKLPTKSNAGNGGFVRDVKQLNDTSKKKENGPKIPLFTKISVLLSSKEVYSPSRTTLTQKDLDRLLEKRQRKSANSNLDGLYSASTTPATSFRQVSPITSPKASPRPSQFHELMIHDGANSFEKKLAKSPGFLQTYLDEGGMPPVHEGSHHHRVLPQTPRCTTRGEDADDCSACSKSNLFFLKTTCRVCGKAFCPSCKNIETKEVIGGRRCRNNCGVKQSAQDGFVAEREKAGRNAWWKIRFGSCIRG